VNLNANTFTLEGLPGLVFTVQNGITEFMHVSGFDALKSGDWVKVRARVSGTSLLVSRIDLEADSPSTDFKINEVSVGSTVFFATLEPGMFVKVNGQLGTTTSTVTWREIDIDE
jgi:hypothetical protein